MTSVKPIPDGYSTITPFFNMPRAGEAIDFYKRAFGAEEIHRMTLPDGSIAMAELRIGSSILRLSDAARNPPTQSGCQLYVEDVDAWWKRAVAAGMQVVVPLADMFFGERWGLVVDPWGNRWTMATRKEDLDPAEIERRGREQGVPG